jgi:hypothetical protein
MLSSTTHQASLFYVAFAREAALIKDDLLEPINTLLDDSTLVDLIREAQASRCPRSRTMGRRAVAPDVLDEGGLAREGNVEERSLVCGRAQHGLNRYPRVGYLSI